MPSSRRPSRLLREILEAARDLDRADAINRVAMKELEDLCLGKTPSRKLAPRQRKRPYKHRSPIPGKFRYFIGTSINENKSGELEAKKVGNVYRTQETMTLDIVKSGKLVVHARAVDFPASSAFANKPYNCTGVKPIQGVTTTVN